MGLTHVEKVLNMQIPLKEWDKDTYNLLDPIYNREKIYERPIVNAKVSQEENNDIMH